MKRKAITGLLAAGVLLITSVTPVQAENQVDTYGTYHAALGVQTDSYRRVFRDAYFDGDAEQEEEFQKLKRERSQGSGAEGAEIQKGKFKDVTIKGNGTYTVSLKNADFHWERKFRKLYVATDIPNTQEIEFSNMSVNIDGRVLRTFEEPVLDVSKTYRKNCVLLAIHPVNEDVKNAISTRTVPRNQDNVIKIRFTVSGFDYDKGETPETPTPKPTATPEVTEAPVSREKATQEPKSSVAPKKDTEMPVENEVGIVVTIIVAIGGVLGCLVVVTKRSR